MLYAYAATANPSETQPRTASLTLTRQAMAATPAKTIEVSQRLFQVVEGGKSNCYIVPPGSAVTIPVERANESPLPIGGTTTQIESSTTWSASLVWESSVGLVTLSNNTGTGASGRFKVAAMNATPEGNAVVAIKNASGDILWSWHIWVTDYDGTTTFTNNNGVQDFVFMDRALGAASATPGELSSCGLMYQWGRKDPFPGIGQQGGTWTIFQNTDPIKVYNVSGTAYSIALAPVPTVIPNNLTNATRNPDTYYYGTGTPYDWFTKSSLSQNNDLWSGGTTTLATPILKSVFDPCPIGWRIAPWLNGASPFAGMTGSNGPWNSAEHGRTWSDAGGYFPALGYRLSDTGRIYDVGSSFCWSGSPKNTDSYHFAFDLKTVFSAGENARAIGFPVRCCRDNL